MTTTALDALPASRDVLGMRVDATSYRDATDRILAWSRKQGGRIVCAANVHMTMEAWDDASFRDVVNSADLVTPDGMPLVWALRRMGVADASRVYGPTLMLHVCEAAARGSTPIGLYGSSPEVLERLQKRLRETFPTLPITYAHSPPFRPLDDHEEQETVDRIQASGARILFVGLGCPKQERWMARHRGRLNVVQLGVGAAFDFHAGTLRQAPHAMQRAGLEWAFRLAMEPRRLGRRYLRHNPRFVWHLTKQLWAERTSRQEASGD